MRFTEQLLTLATTMVCLLGHCDIPRETCLAEECMHAQPNTCMRRTVEAVQWEMTPEARSRGYTEHYLR